MKSYLHQKLKKPGKNNAHNLTFLKTTIFLILMIILTSLASAQVEFRDSNGFDFYNELGLYGDLSVEDGNVSMNDNRILGLPEPTSSGEPLTLGSGSGDYVDRTGDSMTGDLDIQDNYLLGDNGAISLARNGRAFTVESDSGNTYLLNLTNSGDLEVEGDLNMTDGRVTDVTDISGLEFLVPEKELQVTGNVSLQENSLKNVEQLLLGLQQSEANLEIQDADKSEIRLSRTESTTIAQTENGSEAVFRRENGDEIASLDNEEFSVQTDEGLSVGGNNARSLFDLKQMNYTIGEQITDEGSSVEWQRDMSPTANRDLPRGVAYNDDKSAFFTLTRTGGGDEAFKRRIVKRSINDGSKIWEIHSEPDWVDEEIRPNQIAYHEGYLYQAGADYSDKLYVDKIDPSDGSVVWHEEYTNSGSRDYMYDMHVDDSGVYLAGRDFTGNPNRTYRGLIVKYDHSGNQQWDAIGGDNQKHFQDHRLHNAIEQHNGNVYLSVSRRNNSAYWRKTRALDASDGSVLWEKEGDYQPGNTNYNSGIAVDDSGVYVSGYVEQGTAYRTSAIQKRELGTGDLIWEKKYPTIDGAEIMRNIVINEERNELMATGSALGSYLWGIEKDGTLKYEDNLGPSNTRGFDFNKDSFLIFGDRNIDGTMNGLIQLREFGFPRDTYNHPKYDKDGEKSFQNVIHADTKFKEELQLPESGVTVDGTARFNSEIIKNDGNANVHYATKLDNMNGGIGFYILTPWCEQDAMGTIYGERDSGARHFRSVDFWTSTRSGSSCSMQAGLDAVGSNYREREWGLARISYKGSDYLALQYRVGSFPSTHMYFDGMIDASNTTYTLKHVQDSQLDEDENGDPDWTELNYNSWRNLKHDTVGINTNGRPDNTFEVWGDSYFNGSVSKEAGSFLIDHPNPEKKDDYKLRHSFVESPTRGDNIYRYEVNVTDGKKTVDLPDYFQHLNEDIQEWVSADDHFGDAYAEVNQNKTEVTLKANQDGVYNLLVIGTRKDEAAKEHWDEQGVEFKK